MVRARLQRIDKSHDLSLVLAPEALREARKLARAHREDDLEARFALGWFHWYRHLALQAEEHERDFTIAIDQLTPCFVRGMTGLPGPLLPFLVDGAASLARQRLTDAQVSFDPDILSEAVELWRRIVQAVPADDPTRAARLGILGRALTTRFERHGAVEDLEAAVEVQKEALAASSTVERADLLNHLGGTLQTRYGRFGAEEDLDAAVSNFRQAVAAAPPSHPLRAAMLSNLGTALADLFERKGMLEDLEAAVEIGRQAVAATPIDDPGRAMRLSNLGSALLSRFERIGALGDVEVAVDYFCQAVTSTPADDPERGIYLGNLGAALQARFERTGVPEDLDAAIEAAQEALAITPDGTGRATSLSNIAGALLLRVERTRAVEDLDAAIGAAQEAVTITPAGDPERGILLGNLGAALQARFERTGVLEDLDAAIEAGKEGVATTPTDDPRRAVLLSHLGHLWELRFQQTNSDEDLQNAVACRRLASETEFAAASIRVEAGGAAAILLAQSGEIRQAAEIAEAAVLMLPQVAPRRLRRRDQHFALEAFGGLAGVAASLVLAASNETRVGTERALKLLEVGRGVLLSQSLESRSDLTDLHKQHPVLARRFMELREGLDDSANGTHFTGAGIEVGDMGLHQERLPGDRRELDAEYTAVLDAIRELDGFSSFALPPATEELVAEASQGPVVVFNISQYRSDALLITTEGITSLELPHLTLNRVIDQVVAFRRARYYAASAETLWKREEAQATLVEVLQWLWDVAAGPVLKRLGYDRVPVLEEQDGEEEWPHVWWVPGGLLGMLPIHAAGYHTDSADDSPRRTVMDRVVSSYTPTVRALRYARERALSSAAQTPEVTRSLVVAMPTTPGHDRLSFVNSEVAMLQDRLPGLILLRKPAFADGQEDPTGTKPTKANVLKRLPECAIVHFACHGASDPDDPSKSLLLLHDHADDPLTVASLAPITLDQARLAYLSACRTSASDKLPDEAIHLTSAFQLAGFPHVIGTLWEIDDQVAVTIADLFYTALQTDSAGVDPERAARALHQAVRRVRDGHGLPAPFNRTRAPLLWAAYLHAGA